jgi:hypothetical protein
LTVILRDPYPFDSMLSPDRNDFNHSFLKDLTGFVAEEVLSGSFISSEFDDDKTFYKIYHHALQLTSVLLEKFQTNSVGK